MPQNLQSSIEMHVGFAKTPQPPYYAVIFTSHQTKGDRGYEAMAKAMFALALKQPGCWEPKASATVSSPWSLPADWMTGLQT